MGISKEGQEKLFQNYSSLEEHKNCNSRGTGLGLCISNKIIKKMGGHITVSSEIGQGTTFTIELTALCKKE